MVTLELILDGTVMSSGPSFDPDTTLHVTGPIKVIGMPAGTAEGNPTVLLRIALPDGREMFAETTLKLFTLAADTLKAFYGQTADEGTRH